MEIQARNRRISARVAAVREVRPAVAFETRRAVTSFYSEFFDLQLRESVGLRVGGLSVGPLRRGLFFVFRHDPPVDSCFPRLRLLIDNLDELVKRLTLHNVAHTMIDGLGVHGRSLHVTDPTGHLIEVRESRAC